MSRPHPHRGPAATALALALLVPACGGDADPRLDVAGHVERCKDHLAAIHAGLCEYARRNDRPPQSSGVALLAELVASGVWDDAPESRALLTCPGPNAELPPPDTSYLQVDELSDASSAYAGRNARAHPFVEYPEGGAALAPVAACDNVGGTMNHPGLMNVLYSDGSIRTLVLAELIERGKLPPGTTVLVPGPASPIEDLRVLTVD